MAAADTNDADCGVMLHIPDAPDPDAPSLAVAAPASPKKNYSTPLQLGDGDFDGDGDGGADDTSSIAEMPTKDPWFMFKFRPDPNVDWSKLSLTRNAFWYDDETVNTAFRLSYTRDQLMMPVTIAYIFGSIYFALFAIDAKPLLSPYIMMCVGIGCMFAFVCDEVAYFKLRRNVPRFVLVRQVAAGITAVTVLYVHSWLLFHWQGTSCPVLHNFTALPEPSRTLAIRDECTEHIDIRLTIVPLGALMLLKNSLLVGTVFYVLCFITTWAVGAVIAKDTVWTYGGRQVAVTLLIHVWAMSIGYWMFRHNYAHWREQFEKSIQRAIAAHQAANRQTLITMLLESMVPTVTLDALLEQQPVALHMPEATILFSDMASFTYWSSSRTAGEVVSMLNVLVTQFDHAAEFFPGLEKVKTIGDAYWCIASPTLGCPGGGGGTVDGGRVESSEHAMSVCNFALRMLAMVQQANSEHPEWKKHSKFDGIQLRIGVHSGPSAGAILGTAQVSFEPFGETNDVASLCEQRGVPGRVCVSEATVKLLALCEDHNIPIEPHPDGTQTVPRTGNPNAEQPLFLLKPDRLPRVARSINPTLLAASRRSTVSMTTVATFAKRHTQEQRYSEKRRTEFLERQATKRGEIDADMSGAETRWQDVGSPYVKRKFACCFLHLKHSGKEAAFWEFTHDRWRTQRKGARIASLVFFVLVTICALIDGRPLNPLQWVFFALAVLLCIPAVVISVALSERMRHAFTEDDPLASKLPYLDYYFGLFAWTCAVLACGIQGGNVVSNYPSYVYICGAVLASQMAPQTPWGAFAAWVHDTLFLFLPTVALLVLHRKGFFLDHMQNLVLANLVLCLFRYVQENINRQQFAEAKETAFVDGQRESQMKATETVLGTMVPAHVTPALLNWIGDGMSEGTQVSREYDWLALSFVYLRQRPGDEVADGGDGAATSAWMLRMHAEADGVLKRFKRLTKIKSIGSCVMLAGPFEDRIDTNDAGAANPASVKSLDKPVAPSFVVEAAAQAVAFADALREATGLPILAGVHIGPVMAAPIGTSRLSFDVFGDTVNTASRVTTTAKGDISVASISVTETVIDAFGSSASDEFVTGGGFRFGPVQMREAKGKGALPARVVIGHA